MLLKFLKDPLNIGAIAPTSKYTAKLINDLIPKNSNVLELGSGTGAITLHLTKAKNVDTVDMNYLSDYQLDALKFLEQSRINHYDIIVSSLPTRSMPPAALYNMMDLISKKKGVDVPFIQLNYSKSMHRVYKSFFKITYDTVVWRNLPPAVITVMK